MNIYISNLNSTIGNTELEQLFAPFGTVKSAEVVNDVFTGESRGFGYVELEDETAAQKAVAALHKTQLENLTISVEEAKPKVVHQGSYKVGDGPVEVYRFKKN